MGKKSSNVVNVIRVRNGFRLSNGETHLDEYFKGKEGSPAQRIV